MAAELNIKHVTDQAGLDLFLLLLLTISLSLSLFHTLKHTLSCEVAMGDSIRSEALKNS